MADHNQRTLFLSFSGLLQTLDTGKVAPATLDDGLFFFGCARELVFPTTPAEQDALDKEIRRYGGPNGNDHLVTLIRPAVQHAESEGHVSWRDERDPDHTYERLNSFLTANGYPALPYEEDKRTAHARDLEGNVLYDYDTAIDLMKKYVPGLQARWR